VAHRVPHRRLFRPPLPVAELGIMKMTFVSDVTILRFVDNANEFLKRVEVFRRSWLQQLLIVPPPPAT
jgi:hypothetical protein